METTKLIAKSRTEKGKGAARRLRNAGEIPAVAYGKNVAGKALSVSPKVLEEILTSTRGRNTVIDLEIEGDKGFKALLCDFQYHPVTRRLLHADFLEIQDDTMVEVDVPFVLRGRSKGQVLGGVLRQVFRRLPIRCFPKDIPEQIAFDITELDLDATVTVADLQKPDGVEFRLGSQRTVAAIITEKRRGGDKAEGEEGEAAAAAPAKGAAPAKS